MKKITLISLFFGFAVTAIFLWFAYHNLMDHEREIFEYEFRQNLPTLVENLTGSRRIAQGLQSMFRASEYINVDTFRIVSDDILHNFPFIKAVYYSPKIIRKNRTAFEKEQRSWGIMTFEIFEYGAGGKKMPAPERGTYFPILYFEPYTPGTVSNIGYDLLSDKQTLPSFEKAVSQGAPVPSFSPPATGSAAGGFKLFVPVFQGKQWPKTSTARKQTVNGMIVLKADGHKLMALDTLPENTSLVLTPRSRGKPPGSVQPLIDKKLRNPTAIPIFTLSETHNIDIPDLNFVLTFKKLVYLKASSLMGGIAALVLGFMFTVGLFLILRGRYRLKKELAAKRKAQQELIQHRDRLEELVLLRTKRLEKQTRELINARELSEQAKREAQTANRAKSEFLANMSHEIRTPLNAVIGFSDLLSSAIKEPKQKSHIESIQTAGKSLLRLINDILDLSKIEANRLELKYSPIDFRALINEVERIFSQQVSQKDLQFITEVEPALPASLLLDEVRLRQILINLVGNAVKFTEKGHVKLTIGMASKKEVDNILDIDVSVEDTGIGISEHETARIFESFRQQAGQSSSKFGGTGLGLAICKRLVEMMDGAISVKSVLGKGSTFTVNIRNVAVSHKVLPAVEDQSGHETPKLEKAKILVVGAEEKNNADRRANANSPVCLDYRSPETASNLSKIVEMIDSDFMGRWEDFQKVMPMNTVRKFGNELEALGSKYTITLLSNYGRELLSYANNFDVENMKIMITQFPEIVNELKALAGKRST